MCSHDITGAVIFASFGSFSVRTHLAEEVVITAHNDRAVDARNMLPLHSTNVNIKKSKQKIVR